VKNRAKRRGELRRMVRCPFCGQEHRRRSKEQRECRQRHRAGKPPPPSAAPSRREEARPGSEVTRYETDPLKGDKRAHAIARKLRYGKPPRQVAKELSVPVKIVREVEAALVRSIDAGDDRQEGEAP
jgi:hypothetical protein